MGWIDWTPLAGTGYTGTVEAMVTHDGLVKVRGTIVTTLNGTNWAPAGAGASVVIPPAFQAPVGVYPVYIDYEGYTAPGTLNAAHLSGVLQLGTYNPAGDVLVLTNRVAWQGPVPPDLPGTNRPAVYSLGGITFNDGVPDADGTRWYASITDGVDSPDQAIEVEQRAGAHGTYFAGGWYGKRPLVLEGQVVALNYQRLKAARTRLAAATSLLQRLGVLEVYDPVPWRAEVYRADRPRFAIESPTYARFSVPLAAPDPRRYALAERSGVTNLSSITTGVSAPVSAPVSAGGGTGSQIVALNDGTEEAPVRLELAGPLTNPVITHTESGGRIALAITILAGDVLVIDTYDKTVLLGGVNRRPSVTGSPDWFLLQPGVNAIRLAASSTDPAGTLTARWRDTYI